MSRPPLRQLRTIDPRSTSASAAAGHARLQRTVQSFYDEVGWRRLFAAMRRRT